MRYARIVAACGRTPEDASRQVRAESGGAAAAAWLAIVPEHPQLRMPMTGARLIGERSQGVDVQILENGRAVALPSADPDVRIYWVEPTTAPSAKRQ